MDIPQSSLVSVKRREYEHECGEEEEEDWDIYVNTHMLRENKIQFNLDIINPCSYNRYFSHHHPPLQTS